MATDFVEVAPAVEVRDENAFFTWPSGRKFAMPLRICRLTGAAIINALNAHDQGNVLDFRSQKRPRKRGDDVAGG